MAAARPQTDDRQPDVERLALELGRLLLGAVRDHPPPWPEPAGDPDEPALTRKRRRQRRRREAP